MVKIALQLKVDLENLTNFRADGDDFRWYLRLQCSNCNEETSEFQYLSLAETVPVKGGRGHVSLLMKCKLCSRENSIDILKDSIKPYRDTDSGRFATAVVFDCRGLEPIDFSPRAGFVAEGVESGTPFTEIAFNDGDPDWVDYDEPASQSVGVYNIEHKFVVVK
ncbi:CXXC motif containing zinc binding protein-like isoform X2 [Ostrea edulis]|uniref:CXXC motif containing zinc binding protein-like isoform X2 n=1 Tax=Ostrea edulis TaxID=37623 RepID=UPI0020954DB9|nr:CXXC motif containing zinc binding protein-like isoform X2 [Ostrea edulis]